MIKARIQLLRLYVGTTDVRRWQNYSVGNNIKKQYTDTKKFRFMPFEITSGTETGAINVSALNLNVPATPDNVFLFSYALEGEYLCDVETYEFDSTLGDTITEILPVSKLLVTSYSGQIQSVDSDFKMLSVEVGSSELAVTASMPPRTFNNFLVGVPFAP